MANDTNIRGLYPILNQNGQPPQILYFRANTAVAIYRGHPVFINNSGQVQIVDVNTSNNSNTAVGVAWTFLDANYAGLVPGMTLLPNALGGTNYGPFLPASTDAFVGVTYDPMQLYVIEEDTAGTALNVNSANQGLGFTYQATTGNNFSGYANITTIRATILSSTGNLLQLMGPLDIINQDATLNAPGNYAKWLCRIQRHQYAWPTVPQ